MKIFYKILLASFFIGIAPILLYGFLVTESFGNTLQSLNSYILQLPTQVIEKFSYLFLGFKLQALLSSFFAVILAVIFSFLLHRPLAKTLEKISGALKKVSQKEFNVSLGPITKDKSGDLMSNFNQMVKNLRQLTEQLRGKEVNLQNELKKKSQEIEEVKMSLGKRVEQRTQELEEETKNLIDSRKALMNILGDVQEAQKQAEREKDKTFSIIENFSDGLLLFNREDKLSLINPQAQKFFSLRADQLINKSLKELILVKNLKPLISLFGKHIKKLFREELKLRENLILEVSTILIEFEKGQTQTLVILHDITREKNIEKLKTEFVSISAHQLRTPLSAIKWTLRMLLDGDVGKISSSQKEILDKAYQSNERMIRLINDLLNVARIEEGRFLYDVKKCDLAEITKELISNLKSVIKKKKLKLEFISPTKKIPRAKVDREKISLAIDNLIENAIHYTSPEGKIIVSLVYDKQKKEIIFSVKDNGIGISDNQKGRVFSKFFRAPNAVRTETVGSGLGLFTTKNIIEAHGGKIWFDSRLGEGSTFYFSLPIKD